MKKAVLIPDSFKGALSSLETGEAIARGVRHALAEAGLTNEILVFPAADGGEGTAEAVCAALHGRFCALPTTDLFGHPIEGVYADLPGEVPTAVLDMASAAGIGFARQYGPDPMRATTYGVGVMLDRLVSLGYKRILVGLGGSGTNDGGIGALAALGAMFRDVDADAYVLVDGDDTYPAEEVHKLLKPVLEGNADMVIGDRLSSTYYKENKRPFHNFGNSIVKWSINTLFKSDVTDIMTGYRAFSRRFVKTFPVLSKGFDLEDLYPNAVRTSAFYLNGVDFSMEAA